MTRAESSLGWRRHLDVVPSASSLAVRPTFKSPPVVRGRTAMAPPWKYVLIEVIHYRGHGELGHRSHPAVQVNILKLASGQYFPDLILEDAWSVAFLKAHTGGYVLARMGWRGDRPIVLPGPVLDPDVDQLALDAVIRSQGGHVSPISHSYARPAAASRSKEVSHV